MIKDGQSGARLQLTIIALVFFGPLLVATWMYTTGRLLPSGHSNHGELLLPVVNLAEAVPGSPLPALADGRWVLLYANDAQCESSCRDALYRSRQIRLMLGKDMDRLSRVFLHGDSPLDTVFLENEHKGLQTITDKGLAAMLEHKRPAELASGGIYLVDPLSNLVMYFSPELDPRDIAADLQHLLELSRIG